MADGGRNTCNVDDEKLRQLSEKYGICPGTTHYFRQSHECGLGGMVLYFPKRLFQEDVKGPGRSLSPCEQQK